MPFHFTCPYCFKKTLVDESLAGREGPCAGCAKTIKIPEPPRAVPDGISPAQAASPRRAAPKALVWAVKLTGFAVVSGLVAGVALYLLWPSLAALKSRRDQIACMTNLRRIAVAIQEYAAEHGSYPTPIVYDSAGKPLYSWRVLILPQLGHANIYAKFHRDEAWDSMHNVTLIPECPEVYISPAVGSRQGLAESNYVLITGKGTLFPTTGPLSPSDISDPASGTLLVVETANTSCVWSQPTDIDAAKMNSQIGKSVGTLQSVPSSIGGTHSGGATVVFADGTAAWLPDDTPPEVIQAMISPQGGEPINTDSFRAP